MKSKTFKKKVGNIQEKTENIQETPEPEVAEQAAEPTAEVLTKSTLDVRSSSGSPAEPAPKKRGRPPGAKNKPKAEAPPPPAQATQPKRKARVVAPPPSESESEEEPPPSPATQRRAQWAAYRQKQVDVFQARQAHYAKSLDKMLGF